MTRKDMPTDPTQIQIAITAAIQRLVEKGLLFDTGRKRWTERTGRDEIVWAYYWSQRDAALKYAG